MTIWKLIEIENKCHRHSEPNQHLSTNLKPPNTGIATTSRSSRSISQVTM